MINYNAPVFRAPKNVAVAQPFCYFKVPHETPPLLKGIVPDIFEKSGMIFRFHQNRANLRKHKRVFSFFIFFFLKNLMMTTPDKMSPMRRTSIGAMRPLSSLNAFLPGTKPPSLWRRMMKGDLLGLAIFFVFSPLVVKRSQQVIYLKGEGTHRDLEL